MADLLVELFVSRLSRLDEKAEIIMVEKGTQFLAGMSKYSGFQTIRPKTRANVIGDGFIGIETVENLVHRGFEVSLIQRRDQVLGPHDREMARVVEAYLGDHGVEVCLNDVAVGFNQPKP